MNALDTVRQLISIIQALLKLAPELLRLAQLARQRLLSPAVSYENLSLRLTVDLQDTRGQRALITRHQRVRFLSREAGVIESPIWGEGKRMARYRVEGARRLANRFDGPREVLLLGLTRRAEPNRALTLRCRRTVTGGFVADREYFETVAERPTRRLSLRVRFPRTRPPREAYLVAGTQSQALPIRIGSNGRAQVSWTASRPLEGRVYSLRWAW